MQLLLGQWLPAVHNVGVDAVLESDRCYGGTSLAALADNLEFKHRTVKPPLGDFGASFTRHGVHVLHRAHYRRGSAAAQDALAERIQHNNQIKFTNRKSPVNRRSTGLVQV